MIPSVPGTMVRLYEGMGWTHLFNDMADPEASGMPFHTGDVALVVGASARRGWAMVVTSGGGVGWINAWWLRPVEA